MKRVTPIGGIFFKAKDTGTTGLVQAAPRIDVQEWGGAPFTLERR